MIGDEAAFPDVFAKSIGDLRAIPARPELIRNFLRVIRFAISAPPLTLISVRIAQCPNSAGGSSLLQTVEGHGWPDRAYMEVFTACLEKG
jgi:hypothetical protein